MDNKTYKQKWYEENKERILAKYQENKINQDKELIKEQKRIWYLKNKERVKQNNFKLHHIKYKTDILYKTTLITRSLINKIFKNKNYKKNSKTIEILGCTFEEFKIYLESKFEPWMNWDNQGNWDGAPTEINTSWDIDHITPLSIATTEEEILKLCHYTNLQPLCSYTNRYIKRDK